jgi:hypothetical protein
VCARMCVKISTPTHGAQRLPQSAHISGLLVGRGNWLPSCARRGSERGADPTLMLCGLGRRGAGGAERRAADKKNRLFIINKLKGRGLLLVQQGE